MIDPDICQIFQTLITYMYDPTAVILSSSKGNITPHMPGSSRVLGR